MTLELRQKIYELIKAMVLPKMRYDNDMMNVLSSVWNVYALESTGEDYRYKVLGDEIEKHYIMNDDWVDDKLFVRPFLPSALGSLQPAAQEVAL